MNCFLICCFDKIDFDYLNNFFSYWWNNFCFYCMMSFVIYRWNSVYSWSLNGNWLQEQILFCLNSIVNSYFDFDNLDYLIDYINFVRNFVNFFVPEIYLYNLSYMVIDFMSSSSFLEVVFQSCYYCVYFCLVYFDLFSCTERMIYLDLCVFVVYFDCLAVFVYIRQ